MIKLMNKDGFTLIEVMVSMILMVGIVLGTMAFFYMASSGQFDARLHEYVLNLQEDALEQRLAEPYLSLKPFEGPKEDNFTAFGKQFVRIYTASEVNTLGSTYNERYKIINVTVTWNIPDGNGGIENKSSLMKSLMSPREYD